MVRKLLAAVLLLLLPASTALATGEPPLEPGLNARVQAAARAFIETQMVDGIYLHYDADKSEVRRLEFKMLRPVVEEEGEVYVARADFFDEQGRPVSLKFLVVMDGYQPHLLDAVPQA